MSEYVHYKGRLDDVTDPVSLEKNCENIMRNLGYEFNDFYESWEEMLREELYNDFVVVGDRIYEVTINSVDDEDSFFTSKRNDDSSVSFECRYYNGGCSLSEAIEYCLKNGE